MREIPKVKPSMGAWEGRVGEGGPARLERERKSSRIKETERWREEGRAVSLSWRTLWCLCCGCVGLWHDDLGQKVKITLPGITTLLWCLLLLLGLEEDMYLYLTLLLLPALCFTHFHERSSTSCQSADNWTLLRQDHWISVCVVSCVSAVSDQVQSLVICWTGSLSSLFTVAKFFTCTEMMGMSDKKVWWCIFNATYLEGASYTKY